ncbi:MAG: DUF4301 family protein [Prevotellaceae bacterium]|nr:DUF4301 family protein [Prevotellaceae bacterium]
MLQPQDLKQLEEMGITTQQLEEQLNAFKTGFPFLKLDSAASIGNGIMDFGTEETDALCKAWDEYTSQEGRKVVKFVPASGAASRMFKNLFAFVSADYSAPTTDFEKKFFDSITLFAFYDELNRACEQLYGAEIPQLVAQGKYKEVVKALLNNEGLGYGQKPKGLLKFHSYETAALTPVEEHLTEAALYAKDKNGKARLHFTVSAEHQKLFENLLTEKTPGAQQRLDTEFEISLSQQKPSTDTVAVTPDNEIFRTSEGKMLFRPGGHGSLIENLSAIDADVVFIKNIDNVVPDRLKGDTVRYKKLIAGLLVSLQKQVFDYAERLASASEPAAELLDEIKTFLQKNFSIKKLKGTAEELSAKLNRPIRVCAMVKNVGEPGGGPFIAYNQDGTASLQILESSQIDMANPEAVAMFQNGTHFNPVDLVCGLKDRNGKAFDLTLFIDKNTGFISEKSKDGRELKALERPGLWNGAMSDWLTVFVEVPLTTFNPVKTVNDLLRPQHQGQ